MFGKKGISEQESEAIRQAEIAKLEKAEMPKQAAGATPSPSSDKRPIEDDSDDVFASHKSEREINYGDQEILSFTDKKLETDAYTNSKSRVFEMLLEKFNFEAVRYLTKQAQQDKIASATRRVVSELALPLNSAQTDLLCKQVVDDTLGFGPLEKVLRDADVSDIMINGARSVYVEKHGKIYPTDLTFASESHLLNVIQKIVSKVGRRVDESSPMVDARMPDGSRFNAIIRPLALDGALVSIRKFKRDKMRLKEYIGYGSLSPEMVDFLSICAASRLNILISGGTGSGKTTLLNALSEFIDIGERVVTIEDAAELQLKQPHILRLETRPPNMEGAGAITQRALLKNSLRMRPDRIILGEIRGDEVIDVLQAMNTGHEGSMATIHSNNPRDCMSRLENLFSMSGIQMPTAALRQQISNSIHLVVQISRMRDGGRRITNISEVMDYEGGEIKVRDLFNIKVNGMKEDGTLDCEYESTGIVPEFASQISYFGKEEEMYRALGVQR